jgi:tetrapyrrole methylase family protein/MazG family protein
MKKYLREFGKLVGIFSILRSNVKHLFSEAEEVKQAIKNKDKENLEEELGDIFFAGCFSRSNCQRK